ncbi:MAG: hypothetical protein ACFFAZ_13100 [Promethearchaeota archaeon]
MLFGSILYDVVVAFFFGFLGGLGAELADKKGSIELPHKLPRNLLDLGVFSNLIVGGIAAWALFFLLETTDPARFIGASVAAGVGGSATLIAIKEKMLGVIKQREAEIQTRNAEDASEKLLKLTSKVEDIVSTGGVKGIVTNGLDDLLKDAKTIGLTIKGSTETTRKILEELK